VSDTELAIAFAVAWISGCACLLWGFFGNCPKSGLLKGLPPNAPPSLPSRPTGTETRVCADIAARQQRGITKYGTTVEANPLPLRDWLQHAYEETLDQAIYLKRAIEELDKKP